MPTAAQIVSSKLEALENVPKNWAKSIEGYQPKLFARLSRLLADLETVDGSLAMSVNNLTSIDTILVELRAFMTQGEYVKNRFSVR